MVKNTGTGHRQGEMKDRSQVQNPKTGQWTKRDTSNGRFIASKPGTFKGVRKEK